MHLFPLVRREFIVDDAFAVLSLAAQSCPTLCDPVGCDPEDPLGSSVHWILQASILEWVAMPFPRGSS